MNKITFFILFFLAAAFALEAQCPDNENIKVQFLGAPQVLNDSVSDNTLTFTVLNKLEKNPSAQNGNKITFNKGTKFHFRFYIDDQQADANQYNRPYALTTENFFQPGIVEITGSGAQGTWKATTTKVPVDESLARSELGQITLEANKDIPLGPQEYITITISGLKSNLPSGPTIANVFIELTNRGCNNFGLQIGEIQKSPIHIGKQKVGIGTNQTNAATLNVNGGMRVEGGALQPGKGNNTGYSFNNGDGSTGIASRKDGQVGVYANGEEVASFEKAEEQTSIALKGVVKIEGSSNNKQAVTTINPAKVYIISVNDGSKEWTWDTRIANYDVVAFMNFDGSRNQQFRFEDNGDGFYSIYSLGKQKYIGRDPNDYRTPFSYSLSGSRKAYFKLTPESDGTFVMEIKELPGNYLNAFAGPSMGLYSGSKDSWKAKVNLTLASGSDNKKLATYINLGKDRKYQYNEIPKGIYGKPTLTVDGSNGTATGFYNEGKPNMEIDNTSGSMWLKGNLDHRGNLLGIAGGWHLLVDANSNLVIKDGRTNTTAMTFQSDGMVRFAKPLSVTGTIDFPAGASSGSVKIEVPYGTTDDWNIWISHMSKNEWNTGPTPWDDNTGIKNPNYLENIKYWTDTYDKKHFTATINTYYAQDNQSNINSNGTPYCCLKYLLVRK